jgi:hypothetical protein
MDELWKKLLCDSHEGIDPERRKQIEADIQNVADDPDITPAEAYRRGFIAGCNAIRAEMDDFFETSAAFFAAFPNEKIPKKPDEGEA